MGQTYRIEVDATALANSVNLPFAMTAQFLGLPVTLLEGNACNHFLVGTCPALNGAPFTFAIDYLVTNILPPMSTVVTSTLWNDFGDVGVCIQVDVNVRAATNEVESLE